MRNVRIIAGMAGAALLALLAAPTARGNTVYRCVDAHGAVTFQDHACPISATQSALHLDDRAPVPVGAASTPRPPPQPRAVAPKPRRAPLPQRAPLPVMYGCVNAVTGKRYVTEHPRGSYLAPLGMTGIAQAPLADVYGARSGTHLSAPETHAKQLSPNLVGNDFVRVRDTCRRLDATQTCAALRQQRSANAEQLREAFSDREAQLKRRAAQIKTQLASCSR